MTRESIRSAASSSGLTRENIVQNPKLEEQKDHDMSGKGADSRPRDWACSVCLKISEVAGCQTEKTCGCGGKMLGPLVRYTVYTEPQGVRKLRCTVLFPWTTPPDGGLLMDVLENKKHGVRQDPISGAKTVAALVRWEDHESTWLRGIYDPQSGEKTRAPFLDEEKDFRVVGRIRYLDRDDFITREETLAN